MAAALEKSARLGSEIVGRQLPADGWPSGRLRGGWPRLSPTGLLEWIVDDSGDLSSFVKYLDDGFVRGLLEVEMPHLDPERRVVMVVGFGRQRQQRRYRRLHRYERAKWTGDEVYAVRLFVPATDADVLAEEFDTSCRRATRRQREAARRRLEQDPRWSGEEIDEKVQDLVRDDLDRICGQVHQLEPRDGYLVADIWLATSLRSAEREPTPVQLEADRGESWRRTSALQAFEQNQRALAAYTTSRATAAMAEPMWGDALTSFESSAYEFEDVAVFAGGDGEGGMNVDLLRTYTKRGRRVAKAGRVRGKLPAPEIASPLVSLHRAWDVRAGARQTKQPRWLEPSPFQSREDLGGAIVYQVMSNPKFDEALFWHLWTAYPTTTIRESWRQADEYDRRTSRAGWYKRQPSVVRAAFGRAGSEQEGDGPWVAAAYVRLVEGFEEHVGDELKKAYETWREIFDPAIERSEADDGGVEVKAASKGPVDLLIGGGDRVSPVVSARADLEKLAEPSKKLGDDLIERQVEQLERESDKYRARADETDLPGKLRMYVRQADQLEYEISELRREYGALAEYGRRAFDTLSSMEFRSQIGDKVSRSHLHVGPGESERIRVPETSGEFAAPEVPPNCYTDVIRLGGYRHEREKAGDDFKRLPEQWRGGSEAETHAEQVAHVRRRLGEMIEECRGLTGPQRADLRTVRAGFVRYAGRVQLRAGHREAAVERFVRSCELGESEACRLAELYRGLEVPRVKHLMARGGEGPSRHAGGAGLTADGRVVMGWETLREIPTEKTASRGRLFRQRYDWDTPLGQLFETEEPVGGENLSEQREAVVWSVERGLSVDHLDGMLRHVALAHGGDASPLALRVRSGSDGAGRRGYHLLEGRKAGAAAVIVEITADGIDIRVGDETLTPIEGCAPDGPTVCPRRSSDRLEEILEASDGETVSGEVIEQLKREFRVEQWDALLGRAAAQTEGPNRYTLQIVADRRLPVALVAELVSKSLFETESGGGAARVVGRRFKRFYLRARG